MMADKMVPLKHSRKGDRIAFSCISSLSNEPLIDHVWRMAHGRASNLRLLAAVGIDRNDITRPIITRHWYGMRVRRPAAGERILVGLECTADMVRPSGLLNPVFDLSEAVSTFRMESEARIQYRTGAPPLLYDVAEIRLLRTVRTTQDSGARCTEITAYYLDCAKILRAIEELSRPAESGGKPYVRELVMKAAYYIHENLVKARRPSIPEPNWSAAQKEVAGSMVCLPNYWTWPRGGVRLSGRLTDPAGWGDCGCRDEVALEFILSRLKTDDSIHVIPSGPSGSRTTEIIRFLDGKQ